MTVRVKAFSGGCHKGTFGRDRFISAKDTGKKIWGIFDLLFCRPGANILNNCAIRNLHKLIQILLCGDHSLVKTLLEK